MLSCCWEKTKRTCNQQCKSNSQYQSPEIMSIHMVLDDLIHKALCNAEQEFYQDQVSVYRRRNILESGRSRRNHSYVASRAVASVFAADPPPRLEAVESFSRCGRLIFLMIHWCSQRKTEMGAEKKTRQTRLKEKQLACVLLLLGTI